MRKDGLLAEEHFCGRLRGYDRVFFVACLCFTIEQFILYVHFTYTIRLHLIYYEVTEPSLA